MTAAKEYALDGLIFGLKNRVEPLLQQREREAPSSQTRVGVKGLVR